MGNMCGKHVGTCQIYAENIIFKCRKYTIYVIYVVEITWLNGVVVKVSVS